MVAEGFVAVKMLRRWRVDSWCKKPSSTKWSSQAITREIKPQGHLFKAKLGRKIIDFGARNKIEVGWVVVGSARFRGVFLLVWEGPFLPSSKT
jgi:hypothetical protein